MATRTRLGRAEATRTASALATLYGVIRMAAARGRRMEATQGAAKVAALVAYSSSVGNGAGRRAAMGGLPTTQARRVGVRARELDGGVAIVRIFAAGVAHAVVGRSFGATHGGSLGSLYSAASALASNGRLSITSVRLAEVGLLIASLMGL